MDVHLRPFQPEDLSGVTRLLEVSDQVDGLAWPSIPSLWARRLLTIEEDVQKDARLAVTESGEIIGLCLLWPEAGTARPGGLEIRCPGTVHPRWRRQGIGDALLSWASSRWPEIGGDFVSARCKRDNQGAKVLFEKYGFRPMAFSWRMRRPPARVLPPTWPEGIQVRPFDRQRDADALRTAFRQVFSAPESPLTFSREQAWQDFDAAKRIPGSTTLAEADGRLVGFYHVRPCPWSLEEGEVYYWGVVEDWRRRGLGRALLASALGDLAQMGYPSTVVEVVGREQSDIKHFRILGFHEFDRVDWYTLPTAT